MTPQVWGGRGEGRTPATATAFQVSHKSASRMHAASLAVSPHGSALPAAASAPRTRAGGGGTLAADPGHQQHVLARVPSLASKSLPSLDLGLLEAGSHCWAGLWQNSAPGSSSRHSAQSGWQAGLQLRTEVTAAPPSRQPPLASVPLPNSETLSLPRCLLTLR